MDDLIPEVHSEEVLNPQLEKDLIIVLRIENQKFFQCQHLLKRQTNQPYSRLLQQQGSLILIPVFVIIL